MIPSSLVVYADDKDLGGGRFYDYENWGMVAALADARRRAKHPDCAGGG